MSVRSAETRPRDDAESYEIRLQGHLDDRWAAWVDGLAIKRESDDTTALTGTVADQAALHGLFNRIRDLNMTIISVRRVGLRVRGFEPKLVSEPEP
jgi:hypothetical protein